MTKNAIPSRMVEALAARAGYVICTEARSGSTFLARSLWSTNVLGRPFEFFAHRHEVASLKSDPDGTLARLLSASLTPNGIYALKLFGPHFDMVAGERWMERLPNLAFVHLERRDLLGQALSLVRAAQTRQYKSTEAERAPPRYDGRRIAASLARLAHSSARWQSYFARNGIAPLRLVYEDVAADPQEAANQVALRLGLGEQPKVDLSTLKVRIQRDASTDEWRARFIAEAGDESWLDDPFPRERIRKWLRSARNRWLIPFGARSPSDML